MSHSLIWVRLGRDPSSPTCCVWNGTSEGTTSLPRSAVMIPAPAFPAAASTWSVAPRAPAPTRKVTFSPALMMSAILRMSSAGGVIRVEAGTSLERETQCSAPGSDQGMACTSWGSTTTAGCFRSIAVRNAVSRTTPAASGVVMVCT